MDDVRTAYAAGFIDGEGCITIASRYLDAELRLQVGQKVREPLDVLQDTFGVGSIYAVRATDSYLYVANGRKALRVLELVLPYLIVKKEQAKLSFDYYAAPANSTERRRIAEQIKEAKRPWLR